MEEGIAACVRAERRGGGDAMAHTQAESEKEARRKDVGREKGWREVGKGDGDLLSVAEQGLEELGWR